MWRLFPKWRMYEWLYVVQGEHGHTAQFTDTSNIPEEAIPHIEARYERQYGRKGIVVSFYRSGR